MSTFYIATKLERELEHNRVRDLLVSLGHTITYDWTEHGSVQGEGFERLREVCLAERGGVLQADFVVVLLPGGRGTHAELGMAIAAAAVRYGPLKRRLASPQIFLHMAEEIDDWCAFYADPFVDIVVGDYADLIARIEAWAKGVPAPVAVEAV